MVYHTQKPCADNTRSSTLTSHKSTTQALHTKHESFTTIRFQNSAPLHRALHRQCKSITTKRTAIYNKKPCVDNTRASPLADHKTLIHCTEPCTCNERVSPLCNINPQHKPCTKNTRASLPTAFRSQINNNSLVQTTPALHRHFHAEHQ